MFPDTGIMPELLGMAPARQAIPAQVLLCLTKNETVNMDLLHPKYTFISLTDRI